MASMVPPVKNEAYTFYVSLTDQADTKLFKASPTLAAGDVKVATDDGAPANAATLPAVDADFTRRVKVVLSAGEMNGDNVTVIFSDASGAEWCDLTVNIQTVTSNQFDDLATATALATVDGIVDDILTDTGTTIPAQITGLNDLSAADVNAEVDTALGDYDGPTLAELNAALAALNDPTVAEIRAEIDANSTQLAAIVADTNELQTDDVPGLIAALNNLSAAEVNAEVDTALADYDAPTAAELTAAVAPLATSAALATVDANVDSILADTGTDGVVISTATAQAIADAVLSRGVDNVEDTADVLSLTELVLATLESAVSGTTWTIRKSGGTTFNTKTVTVDAAADPVTGVT